MALLQAGEIPDWNTGLNARHCEWVENRHWIYETLLPSEWLADGSLYRLTCLGLDYCGVVLLNGKEIGAFGNSFTPHEFDLTGILNGEANRLQIVFECPPRWLGQFGYTSRMTEWKPRFNYTWDWTPRLVQIGIWDDIVLEVSDGNELTDVRCAADLDDAGKGILRLGGYIAGSQAERVRLSLESGEEIVRSETVSADEWLAGVVLTGLDVKPWFPNGLGRQPLYTLHIELLDDTGGILDENLRRVGFKTVTWGPCEGAPSEADPWICHVNGIPVFLQGVNWTPIRPNFADLTLEDYRQRLELYRDLGCNVLRVWGGAVLEKTCFYDLCDDLGLMVWQEFPMSSSGVENWPPEDDRAVEDMVKIARSYVLRRQHHASLLLWCGGNELQGTLDGGKQGIGKPVDLTHPMMARIQEMLALEDPGRRFMPASSSGPRFLADESDFGKGLHWDVHGPWSPQGAVDDDWSRYWSNDDALFRSEAGSAGASPLDIVEQYADECDTVPGTLDKPLWRRSSWWIDWPRFVEELGREPADLKEYIDWSQSRQAQGIAIAVASSKSRFPRCGGIILWMGHDSFPCMANTSVVDFWGRPKPAALVMGEIYRGS